MINARVSTKLIAFVVLALAGTSYLGAKYAGLDLLSTGYQVNVALPDASGLFTGGEVTYRGVQVGSVERLTPTSSGVSALVKIDADAPRIPADVSGRVTDRSVIGEQYLDLTGGTTGHLAEGDRIVVGADGLTPEISQLLRSSRDFAASVPTDDLKTVIDESYDLSADSSDSLRRLISTSLSFQKAADDNFLVSSSLIRNSSGVLATQERSADSIRAWSHDLGVLADQLHSSDGDLRTLIESSPAAARQVGALIDQVGRPLGVLMANLVSTAQVFGTNAAGVQDALVRAPEAVSVGWAVSGSRGMSMGLVPTFFDPLPCVAGYGDTQLRPGTDTRPGRPLNTDAGCTSTSEARGPAAVGHGAPAAGRVDVATSLGDLLGGVS